MNRRSISLKFVGFAVFGFLANLSMAAELKIGVVNAAKVLENAPQMEIARQQMEKEFAPRKKDIVSIQNKLRNQEGKLSRDGAIMSENERRKLERDIRTRQRDLKRLQDEFGEDVNIRRNEMFDKVRRQVREAVDMVGKRGKFDLILNDEVLLFVSDKADITKSVIKELAVSKKKSGKKTK